MRQLLITLKTSREKNELGQLGNCSFEEVEPFFERAIKEKDKYAYKTGTNMNDRVIVAIGDVHGDLLALLSVLYMMDVIDEEAKWIGKDKYVVSTGDWMDRGGRGSLSKDTSHNNREELDIIQYLHALNKTAFKMGGRVIITLGNHELSNVWLETKLFSNYTIHQKTSHVDGWGGTTRKRDFWKPGGLVATYLAYYCPIVFQANSYLFLHGGITTSIAKEFPGGIQEMNAAIRKALMSSPELPERLEPLVFDRSLSRPNANSNNANQKCVQNTRKLFEMLQLDWETGGIVIGHTVQENGIPIFCSGRVWRIDVALSEAFGRKGKKDPLAAIQITLSNKTIVKRVMSFASMNKGSKKGISKSVDCFENGKLFFSEKMIRATNKMTF